MGLRGSECSLLPPPDCPVLGVWRTTREHHFQSGGPHVLTSFSTVSLTGPLCPLPHPAPGLTALLHSLESWAQVPNQKKNPLYTQPLLQSTAGEGELQCLWAVLAQQAGWSQHTCPCAQNTLPGAPRAGPLTQSRTQCRAPCCTWPQADPPANG